MRPDLLCLNFMIQTTPCSYNKLKAFCSNKPKAIFEANTCTKTESGSLKSKFIYYLKSLSTASTFPLECLKSRTTAALNSAVKLYYRTLWYWSNQEWLYCCLLEQSFLWSHALKSIHGNQQTLYQTWSVKNIVVNFFTWHQTDIFPVPVSLLQY